MSYIIRFQPPVDPHDKMPYPVVVTDKHVVTSGLGQDDGAFLIGFSYPGTQRLAILAEDAFKAPERVVDLYPIFSANEQFFDWQCLVKSIKKVEDA